MDNLQKLQISHTKLLAVAKSYRSIVLDKIEEDIPAKTQMNEIIADAIEVEKSIAVTTDF